ncbi:MAG: diguanylate cyclase [Planctomycetaceae bacterium]
MTAIAGLLRDTVATFHVGSSFYWLPVLAVVCLAQFLAHRYWSRWLGRERRRLSEALAETVAELAEARRDTHDTKAVNQLLCSLIEKTTASETSRLVLRRLVPDSRRGFAAVIQCGEDDQRLVFRRGLTRKSIERLHLSAELRDRLIDRSFLVLDGRRLYESGLMEALSPRDRGKVQALSLAAAATDGELSAVLIATDLFPAGADPAVQQELTCRLILAISRQLELERNAAIQQHQLRLTTDMLQLRSIVDRASDSSQEMIEEYLSCLMHLLHADRVAFFLGAVTASEGASVVRCGEGRPARVAARWMQYEELLISAFRNKPAVSVLSQTELKEAGVSSLMGAALVVPLVKDGRTVAHICCTRIKATPFAATEIDLAAWAADDFTNAMYRLLSHLTTARQARLDALTELANRREFDRQIEREWKRAQVNGQPCSLLLLDLDHFKSVNDTYGHQAGDFILRTAAQLLQGCLLTLGNDNSPLAARYGGEELAVVLPNVSTDEAARIAEIIRATIDGAEFKYRGIVISITASIGVSSFPDDAAIVSELIAEADAALYTAKQQGRNQVQHASRVVSSS